MSEIRSNRESGYGRYDVMMTPRSSDGPGIIMEFKKVGASETSEDVLRAALGQIEENEYGAELKDRGIDKMLLIAIALKGKKVDVKARRSPGT